MKISFYKRVFVIIAIGFITGVLLCGIFAMPHIYYIAAGVGAYALLLLMLKRKTAALMFLFIVLGIIRVQVTGFNETPTGNYVFSGRVCETPAVSGEYVELTLNNVVRNKTRMNGKLRLAFFGDASEVEYGDYVTALAQVQPFKGAKSQTNWRNYYYSKGISCVARAKTELSILKGGKDFYGSLLDLKRYTDDAFIALIGQENGAIAAAMLHGDVALISEGALNEFRLSGIAHLLAVSGLNVGLIAAALILILKPVRPTSRFIIISAFLIIYCVFTALTPSAVRSGLMVICLLLAGVTNRKNDQLNALGLSCLIILAFNPYALYDVGLMLSFTAMLGIFLLDPVINRALCRLFARMRALIKKGGENKSGGEYAVLKKEAVSLLSISISGQLATLPVTAAFFSRVPLLSVFANLLVVPLTPLLIFPAIAAIALYPLAPAIAVLPASICDITLMLIRATASAAVSAGELLLPPFSLASGTLYFLTMAFLSDYCRGDVKEKRRMAALCAIACATLWLIPAAIN